MSEVAQAMFHGPLGQGAIWGVGFTVAVISGCEEAVVPELCHGESRPNITSLVTEEAREVVDDNGHWNLPLPDWGSDTRINEAEAVEQALAFVRQFASREPHRSYLERVRGASIDFEAVEHEWGVSLALTPYRTEVPSVSKLPRYIRKVLEDYYVVVLGDDCGPVLAIAVSTLNGDMEITEEGYLVFPARHGNDFFVQAVPRYRPAPIGFLSAEDATVRVNAASGSRIAVPPLQSRPHLGVMPSLARWKFRLEDSVGVRRVDDDTVVRTDVVFVEGNGTFAIRAHPQPTRDTLYYPTRGGQSGQFVVVEVRPGRPIVFDAIEIIG